MEKRKFSIWYIIIAVVIIIIIVAGIKNLNNHHDKEYLVVNKKILETAKECYLKGDCEGDILLKDLYNKQYLSVQINPITKENIDENICITFKDNETKFCKK